MKNRERRLSKISQLIMIITIFTTIITGLLLTTRVSTLNKLSKEEHTINVNPSEAVDGFKVLIGYKKYGNSETDKYHVQEYSITIQNQSEKDLSDWVIEIPAINSRSFNIDSSWNGNFNNASGKIIVSPDNHDKVINQGGAARFSLILTDKGSLRASKIIIKGKYLEDKSKDMMYKYFLVVFSISLFLFILSIVLHLLFLCTRGWIRSTDNERIVSTAIHSVHDNTVIVDVKKGTFEVFTTKADYQNKQRGKYTDFCDIISNWQDTYRERVKVRQLLDLHNVLRELESKDSFMFNSHIKLDNNIEKYHYVYFIAVDRDEYGTPVKCIITTTDVTNESKDRIKMETRLKEQMEKARKANAAKSEFLSCMSHELRTPMNVILGMNEMILREGEGQVAEYANRIDHSGKLLLSIINDILDFTKIEAGKLKLVESDFESADVFTDIIEIGSVLTEGKDLVFKTNIAKDIPCVLHGDSKRFKQIMMNLLSNAAKYTDSGSVSVSITPSKWGSNLCKLTVSVKDTGRGIKKENIERITKPFERTDDILTRDTEGTGLGLAITKDIIKLMGGNLNIRSEYGKGTEMFFDVIFTIKDYEGIGDLKSYNYQENVKESKVLIAPDLKILAVDDSSTNLVILSSLLKRTQIQLDTVSSGFECINMCKEKKYDLILMDHMMPAIDGVETLKTLRKEKGLNSETKAFVITANTISEYKDEYIMAGFDDFLLKPVQSEALESAISEAFDIPLIDTDTQTVNTQNSFGLCKDKETYKAVAMDFVKSAAVIMNELISLHNEEDLKNYTIKIHALKSSSKAIGLNKLSEMARILEEKGKIEDTQYINNNHKDMIQEFDNQVKTLKKQFNIQENDDMKIVSNEGLKDALEILSDFCEVFDLESAETVMQDINKYSVPKLYKSKYELLNKYIFNVELDKAIMLIKELRRVL